MKSTPEQLINAVRYTALFNATIQWAEVQTGLKLTFEEAASMTMSNDHEEPGVTYTYAAHLANISRAYTALVEIIAPLLVPIK